MIHEVYEVDCALAFNGLCYRKVKLIRKSKNISEYMRKLEVMKSDIKGILQQFLI